jgi:four helix bundle protein
MKTRHFRDLLMWQRAMKLARDVYHATESFPRKEVFGLSSQLCRSAVSVPSNIAEGHGRLSDRSFAVFLGHSRGSLFELETQLELAENLGYLSRSQLQKLMADSAEIGRMLNGLLNTLHQP